MGFISFIKSLFNSEAMGDEVIALQVKAYDSAKSTNQEADPHEHLLQVWSWRMQALGRTSPEQLLDPEAVSEIIQIACIPYPKNARALGIYILGRERPDILRTYPKFNLEYEELMGPVREANAAGKTESLYKSLNPRFAAKSRKKHPTKR